MKEFCSGCGNEIDPIVCHCGIEEKDHNWYQDPHNFVPMGCTCGYVKQEELEEEKEKNDD